MLPIKSKAASTPVTTAAGAPAADYGASGVYESIEVRVPDIGDFKDIPIIEVFVKAGDTVKAEDPLISLESDKATMDVPSPVDGVVKGIKVKLVGDVMFDAVKVFIILLFSVIGILGSYGVAWFGIRINTFANSRTAFASLAGGGKAGVDRRTPVRDPRRLAHGAGSPPRSAAVGTRMENVPSGTSWR